MQRIQINKIVYSALFATLIFVGTQFIRVPLPFGYFNFGDCFVLLSALIIGGSYAVVASAIGSGLADILSGYTLYAPATLIIKALMVIVVIAASTLGRNRSKSLKKVFLVIGVFFAEILMVSGYFIYDIILYQLAGATAALFGNITQGIVASVTSILFITVLERMKLIKYIKSL